MIELSEIETLSRKYFNYLIEVFGFTEVSSKTVPFSHIIQFSNANFNIEIRYGFRNKFLEVRVYNLKIRLDKDHYKFVSLHHMMKRRKPDFDYGKEYWSVVPKEAGIEQSFKEISELFKEYAIDILTSKEWYSWEEVMGHSYPDSNSTIKTTIEVNYKKKDDFQ